MVVQTLGAGALSSEQYEQYCNDGYLVLRSAFPVAEIEALADLAHRLFARRELIDTQNIRCRWQDHIETGECLFECFDPVIDICPEIGRIARDPRIIEPLSALYGDEACLFKDKLIFKPPGAKGYGLHQDFIAWNGFPRSFSTVLVAIDPADDENGATEVFPGYHQQGTMAPEDGEYHELSVDLIDESRGIRLDLQPGDIAIFGGFTPHRSAPNRSDRWRRQLYLSYNARNDGGSQREKHYREFHDWLVVKYAQYGKKDVYFK